MFTVAFGAISARLFVSLSCKNLFSTFMISFFQKDIVSVRDFDKQKFETVFQATDKIIEMNQNERREIVRGKTLGYLFFEPSTRTRLSFEAAMASIGGTSLGIADASSSSAKKGER